MKKFIYATLIAISCTISSYTCACCHEIDIEDCIFVSTVQKEIQQIKYDLYYHIETFDPEDIDYEAKYWYLIGKLESLTYILNH